MLDRTAKRFVMISRLLGNEMHKKENTRNWGHFVGFGASGVGFEAANVGFRAAGVGLGGQFCK